MSRYIPLGKARKQITDQGCRVLTRLQLDLRFRSPILSEDITLDTPAVSVPEPQRATPSQKH